MAQPGSFSATGATGAPDYRDEGNLNEDGTVKVVEERLNTPASTSSAARWTAR